MDCFSVPWPHFPSMKNDNFNSASLSSHYTFASPGATSQTFSSASAVDQLSKKPSDYQFRSSDFDFSNSVSGTIDRSTSNYDFAATVAM